MVELDGEKIVVTAALPYANGEIHLGGFASTYLPADVFARFCKLRGADLVYVCATDDFGTPIMVEAEKEGKSPREYVEFWNKRDKEDLEAFEIRYDLFYKTSSEENVKFAQYFFKRLQENGFIYKRSVLQPYCEKDKKYLPDRYVRGDCPFCGAKDQYSDGCERCGRTFEPGEVLNPHCAICGGVPVTRESEHYYFRLSAFSGKLEDWLKGNKNLQAEVKNYVLKWISDGLKDWDITRDIPWGVPIPVEGANASLYLWFDNHLCYISTALKVLSQRSVDGKEFWNGAKIFHFIGKDIVYHHYLFLPAMRLGVGEYKLPDYIPTRGHLMLHGRKFSKSRKWYISLREFLESFPPDYLRYYLCAITPCSQSDVNFDWDDFQSRINNELVATIGNFVHRTLTFIDSKFGGTVPHPAVLGPEDKEFESSILGAAERVGGKLREVEIDRALKAVLDFAGSCNQYFQKKKPWADAESAKSCLYLSVNAVAALAILLEPFLPNSAEALWRQLNLPSSVHEARWEEASRFVVEPGHKIRKPEILFRKVEDGEIRRQKEKLLKALPSGET
ncbi:MAG: methionine--tRNA ligase [Candidatus Brockarchaeota archaeon]|nr:methionine--tRNA ligase [Candidatus Brockarchaeota archaeon]